MDDYLAYYTNVGEDVLTHYGIQGMKWGVRRYQNPDGSLTAAGRQRYGVGSKRASNSEINKQIVGMYKRAAYENQTKSSTSEIDRDLSAMSKRNKRMGGTSGAIDDDVVAEYKATADALQTKLDNYTFDSWLTDTAGMSSAQYSKLDKVQKADLKNSYSEDRSYLKLHAAVAAGHAAGIEAVNTYFDNYCSIDYDTADHESVYQLANRALDSLDLSGINEISTLAYNEIELSEKKK